MWICDRLNIPCSTHVWTQLLLWIKYLLSLTTVETDEVFVFVHSLFTCVLCWLYHYVLCYYFFRLMFSVIKVLEKKKVFVLKSAVVLVTKNSIMCCFFYFKQKQTYTWFPFDNVSFLILIMSEKNIEKKRTRWYNFYILTCNVQFKYLINYSYSHSTCVVY